MENSPSTAPQDDTTNASLSIPGWWETFENNRTRILGRISWFSMPSRCDSDAYLDLTERGRPGFLAMGVHTGLCRAMAGMPLPIRKTGTFTKEDGSPMPIPRVCRLANIAEDIFDEVIPLLTQTNLLSVSGTNPAPTRHQPGTEPAQTTSTEEEEELSAPDSPILAESPNPKPPPISTKSGVCVGSAYTACWKSLPKASRNRSTRKQFTEALDKLKANRPSPEKLLEAIRAWSTCEEWTRENGRYVPAAHRLINAGFWEDLPEAAPPEAAPSNVSTCDSIPEGAEMKNRWVTVFKFLMAYRAPETSMSDVQWKEVKTNAKKFFFYYEEREWAGCKNWQLRLRRWLLDDEEPPRGKTSHRPARRAENVTQPDSTPIPSHIRVI